MEIDVFTLFPEWFGWFASQRHVANVIDRGHRLDYVSYRDFTPLSAGQVDDTPFGGGAGMVLRVDVIDAALEGRYGADRSGRRIVALTPGGRRLDDALASELAAEGALTLLCGRYEGFDQRVVEHLCTDEVSIGPYVLAGGELAAMVTMDAVLRKLPGALGHEASAVEESYGAALQGLPEYPHYTRPASYRGWEVPDVLLSGHHARIAQWRLEEARRRAVDPVFAEIEAREHALAAAQAAGDAHGVRALLAPFATWPPDGLGASLSPESVEVEVHGDTAVARVRAPEASATDTWTRHLGEWRLAARQVAPR